MRQLQLHLIGGWIGALGAVRAGFGATVQGRTQKTLKRRRRGNIKGNCNGIRDISAHGSSPPGWHPSGWHLRRRGERMQRMGRMKERLQLH